MLGGAVAVFVLFVSPRYQNIKALRATASDYASAIENAKKLSEEQADREAQYNAIPREAIDSLETALPNNVDNIRLIIQINSIALKTGMSSLREVDYATKEVIPAPGAEVSPGGLSGEFEMKFSTFGSYRNFLNFISALEQNLRLVDITKIGFEVLEDETKRTPDPKYVVTLKTYWLKN